MTSTTAATAAIIETADLMAEFKVNFETAMHATDVESVKENLDRAKQLQSILQERGFVYKTDENFNVIGFDFRF